MRFSKSLLSLLIILIISSFYSKVNFAQFTIDIESGVVKTGYNDLRIPGDEGSFLSLSDELSSISDLYYRLKVEYDFGKRSKLTVLAAPLNQSYKGYVNRDIVFQNEVFLAGSYLNTTYKFNSYRASYLYKVIRNDKLQLSLGLTIKIRDALIGIQGDFEKYAEKTDFGLVPLIGFRLQWNPTQQFGLLLDGDALAAPQGRAEDVLLALTYKATENLSIKGGYRILEGGADNDILYTFSLFHYAVLGVIIQLDYDK